MFVKIYYILTISILLNLNAAILFARETDRPAELSFSDITASAGTGGPA